MMSSANDFSYVLCPGSLPSPEHMSVYEKVFQCWKDVWSEAFDELGVKKKLHSDAFSRQDYIGALFYKEECVALAFFRWVDAHTPGFTEDSYFANWNSEHIAALTSRGGRVIVCSYFTVHSRVRQKQLGVSVKDLICGLAVKTFTHSAADSMTGAMRVDRSMSALTSRWGSLPIAPGIPSGYGDYVDLVGFFKDHVAITPQPDEAPLVNDLWKRRMTVPRMHLDNEFDAEIIHLKPKKAA